LYQSYFNEFGGPFSKGEDLSERYPGMIKKLDKESLELLKKKRSFKERDCEDGDISFYSILSLPNEEIFIPKGCSIWFTDLNLPEDADVIFVVKGDLIIGVGSEVRWNAYGAEVGNNEKKMLVEVTNEENGKKFKLSIHPGGSFNLYYPYSWRDE
jgi:hypothetical protein